MPPAPYHMRGPTPLCTLAGPYRARRRPRAPACRPSDDVPLSRMAALRPCVLATCSCAPLPPCAAAASLPHRHTHRVVAATCRPATFTRPVVPPSCPAARPSIAHPTRLVSHPSSVVSHAPRLYSRCMPALRRPTARVLEPRMPSPAHVFSPLACTTAALARPRKLRCSLQLPSPPYRARRCSPPPPLALSGLAHPLSCRPPTPPFAPVRAGVTLLRTIIAPLIAPSCAPLAPSRAPRARPFPPSLTSLRATGALLVASSLRCFSPSHPSHAPRRSVAAPLSPCRGATLAPSRRHPRRVVVAPLVAVAPLVMTPLCPSHPVAAPPSLRCRATLVTLPPRPSSRPLHRLSRPFAPPVRRSLCHYRPICRRCPSRPRTPSHRRHPPSVPSRTPLRHHRAPSPRLAPVSFSSAPSTQ
ncbi:hypothetical protein DENSPDRAFT_886365 [Dentipellis sp. KUC8613]|nr:hypothetical protein DENSPDRAFT_886365 [Dentipellis sp. KUC8613]